MKKKFYIIGPWQNRSFCERLCYALEAHNFLITERWWLSDETVDMRSACLADLRGVAEADFLVMILSSEAQRGSHTEMGYALALGKPIYLFVVGDQAPYHECPFYYHPLVTFFIGATTIPHIIETILTKESNAMPTQRKDQISNLVERAHTNSCKKGFWDIPDSEEHMRYIYASKLALVHEEVSEAVGCLRSDEMTILYAESGKPEGLPIELADIIIRVFDLAGKLNIDLSTAIETKMQYNESRPYKHGRKF